MKPTTTHRLLQWARPWQVVQAQFKGFDPRNPGHPAQWPVLPRVMVCLVVWLLVVAVLWGVLASGAEDTWRMEQAREAPLRDELRQKLKLVAQHIILQQQLAQSTLDLAQLEQQLPRQDQMEALLGDISQASARRGLELELFRPGPLVFSDHHAEWPLALRVVGTYHDIARFASDVAQFSPLVNLNDLSLGPVKDRPGWLTLTCTVQLFRRLEPQERKAEPNAPEARP
jgi:type IV pilus assembly protein PilO